VGLLTGTEGQVQAVEFGGATKLRSDWQTRLKRFEDFQADEHSGFPVTDRRRVEGFITAALNGHAALYVGVVFVLFVLYVPNGILGTVRARLGGPVAKRLPERLWGER